MSTAATLLAAGLLAGVAALLILGIGYVADRFREVSREIDEVLEEVRKP